MTPIAYFSRDSKDYVNEELQSRERDRGSEVTFLDLFTETLTASDALTTDPLRHGRERFHDLFLVVDFVQRFARFGRFETTKHARGRVAQAGDFRFEEFDGERDRQSIQCRRFVSLPVKKQSARLI